MQGYRERVTDVELPHIRDLPKALPPLFAAAARRARRRPASTASSFTTRTPTRWPRSFRARTRATTATAARSRTACVCLSRRSQAVRASVGPELRRRLPFSRRRMHRGRQSARRDARLGRRLRDARGWTSFRPRAAESSRTPARPAVGAAAYPYTGPSGYECMPQFISDARGPFGRNAGPTRAIRDAIRAAGLATPVVCAGGVHNFAMAERWLEDGRMRHRRRSAAVSRRSRLGAENLARPRRGGADLRVHQLLRGARPEAQAGHLPALGQARPRGRGDAAYGGRKAAARRAGLDSRVK